MPGGSPHLRLADLARARGLAAELLKKLGWQERPEGVAIPWPLAGGGVAWHVRHRLERQEREREGTSPPASHGPAEHPGHGRGRGRGARAGVDSGKAGGRADADPGPRWTWQGFDRNRLLPYGHERLARMQERAPEVLVIVESEVDAVGLWSAGVSALATGGADGWQDRWWAVAAPFGRVVLWLEDAGSVALLRRLIQTQPDDAPPLYVCYSLAGPAKDPGRILAALNGTGREVLRRIVAGGVPVTRLAHDASELPVMVAERLGARSGQSGFQARCPFHDDDAPSLSIFRGDDGGWGFRCHGGRCGARGPLALLAACLGIALVPGARAKPGGGGSPGSGGGFDSSALKGGSAEESNSLGSGGGFDSSALKGGSAEESNSLARATSGFRFRSPRELLAATPEAVPWVWEGFLARGALTVLGGREKAGKSTLLWGLLRAVAQGRDFCGRPTARTVAVVVTEEAPATVTEKLAQFGITGDSSETPLSILTRSDVPGRPTWEAVVAAATAEAERCGAGLLVIDTLSWWAGPSLQPDAENSAPAMTAALRPLLEAAARGLAVLALHHANKSHGELRGSTAIGAAADIILTLTREPESPTRRRLEAVGRFAACPTEPVVIELDGDRYAALGAPREVSAQGREQAVMATLPPAPPGMTQRELAEATGVPFQRVAEVLSSLLARGQASRTGQGTRRAPYRYHRAAPGPTPAGGEGEGEAEFDSSAEPPLRTEESEESEAFPGARGQTAAYGASGNGWGAGGFDSSAAPPLRTEESEESEAFPGQGAGEPRGQRGRGWSGWGEQANSILPPTHVYRRKKRKKRKKRMNPAPPPARTACPRPPARAPPAPSWPSPPLPPSPSDEGEGGVWRWRSASERGCSPLPRAGEGAERSEAGEGGLGVRVGPRPGVRASPSRVRACLPGVRVGPPPLPPAALARTRDQADAGSPAPSLTARRWRRGPGC